MSILTGLVRRISEAAKGAATDANRIQERTIRFIVMGLATKESEAAPPPPNIFPNSEAEIEIRKLMDVEDFGDDFTPNAEIAKVTYT